MKKVKFLFVALVCLLLSAPVMADDMPIPAEQLPAAAKAFVKKHFAGKKIVYAEKDTEFFGATYEARLSDGSKVEFDKKGNWDKVECKGSAVPAALVPAAIAQYVKQNFDGIAIVKIDKERYGYEIELANDVELKFNKKGALIGMDD